jgi:hypothetical protein
VRSPKAFEQGGLYVSEPTVRFPVTCPTCGNEMLVEFHVADIAAGLISASPILLRVTCHEVSWEAGPIELEQIREYLGASWVLARHK